MGVIDRDLFSIDNKGWKLYYQIDGDCFNDFEVLQLEPFICPADLIQH